MADSTKAKSGATETVGPDFHGQLIVVGFLSDAGFLRLRNALETTGLNAASTGIMPIS